MILKTSFTGQAIYNRDPYFILLFFMAVSVAMRFFSFFPSVLDHDESTYMIIGRDILNGKSLYTDVTDTKPVGIFLFYAALEFLFGSNIFLKRLVFALLVAGTSFLLFKVSKNFFNNNKVAFASGIVYIFYTSVWNYHGRSPNTELLFNFFTIAGLLFFQKPSYRNFFLGGLSIGIGFMVKYLVLLDIFAFLLYFFVLEMKALKKGTFLKIFGRYFTAGLAFALPFALTNLYFWMGDHFHNFYAITYELPAKYGSDPSLTRYILMLLDLTGKFLPISYIFFYTVFKKTHLVGFRHKWFFGLWIASVLYAISIPGKEFNHYTIQLMLPVSLFAGLFFHPEFERDRFTNKVFFGKTGVALLIAGIVVVQFLGLRDDYLKPDHDRVVAEYLQKNMEPDDEVFVSNYEQIIYYLLGKESPTKYVHASLLFSKTHEGHVENPKAEVRRILRGRPKFVLVQRKNPLVENLIQGKYRLEAKFRNDEILVYKRIDS